LRQRYPDTRLPVGNLSYLQLRYQLALGDAAARALSGARQGGAGGAIHRTVVHGQLQADGLTDDDLEAVAAYLLSLR
jgi:hypothetical protein